jgi:uncharacterized protein YndB with AHSA1/START domain
VSVVQVSVEVDAPPPTVWRVVADPNNLPRWDRRITSVRGVPSGGLRVGSEYVTDLRFMGIHARGTARVIDLRPPEYSKVQVRGLIDGTVETWLEPLDGGDRTRLRHRIQYQFIGGPLGRAAARAVNLLGAPALLKRGIQAQKRQAEQSAD